MSAAQPYARRPTRLLAALFISSTATATAALAWSASQQPPFDVLFAGGIVVDGTGAPRRRADVGVRGERIGAIGDLGGAAARRSIDATGLVVAPGFIDMLGWSQYTLLVDPRAVSKVTQGITTEITGEGWSAAPVNAATLRDDSAQFAAWGLTVDWRDFDGYFRRLERSGTPINVGSFVGATQVRKYVLGDVRRAPTAVELAQMVALVDTAMQQGALGLSTSLVYAPAIYARTDELIALARAAGARGGIYISHVRNEGARILQALAEAFRIGRAASVPVEVWHLKLSGRPNWGRMPRILALFDSVRATGQRAGANSYPYAASAASLAATIPAWAHEGGNAALVRRLRDPAIRARLKREMSGGRSAEELFSRNAGGLGGVLVLSVLDTALRGYEGRRITEIARTEGKNPYDALFDLLVADHANTGAAYFSMSEEDVRAAVAAPWVTVGSDFGARAPDGPLGGSRAHPRAYGTFPRILARYVREQHVLTLEAAVRKMSALAAERMGLRQRGALRDGWFADITVFDPATIADVATFENSNEPSVGVRYVMVNGRLTMDDGRLTAERPGRALRGPGWRGP